MPGRENQQGSGKQPPDIPDFFRPEQAEGQPGHKAGHQLHRQIIESIGICCKAVQQGADQSRQHAVHRTQQSSPQHGADGIQVDRAGAAPGQCWRRQCSGRLPGPENRCRKRSVFFIRSRLPSERPAWDQVLPDFFSGGGEKNSSIKPRGSVSVSTRLLGAFFQKPQASTTLWAQADSALSPRSV